MNKNIRLNNLSKNQYWIVIIIAIVFLFVNGVLVYKLLTHEVELDKSCPVPTEEVNQCECVYDAWGDKALRYCTCFPGTENPFKNGSFLDNLNLQ